MLMLLTLFIPSTLPAAAVSPRRVVTVADPRQMTGSEALAPRECGGRGGEEGTSPLAGLLDGGNR